MSDPRPLDRAATELCGAAVAAVKPDQLDLPTPCSEWSLGELIAHLVAENRGFTAASFALPGSVGRRVWQPGPPDETALKNYPAAADEVTRAFAAADLLDRSIEVREFGVFPGGAAVAMHFVDNLAHAWDVARSIGLPDPIPADLAEAALPIAAQIPADRPAGGAFATIVPTDPNASPTDRFLGLLGRNPQWSAR